MSERMEITSSDLLACPFCGDQPKVIRLMGYDYWKTEITCCGFTGVDYDDVIEKRWNTRKPMADTLRIGCAEQHNIK